MKKLNDKLKNSFVNQTERTERSKMCIAFQARSNPRRSKMCIAFQTKSNQKGMKSV